MHRHAIALPDPDVGAPGPDQSQFLQNLDGRFFRKATPPESRQHSHMHDFIRAPPASLIADPACQVPLSRIR